MRYVADQTCVELKSLKLYFHAYRNEGIFFEAVTNQICDDLGALLAPASADDRSDWKGRGGITSVVTAEWAPLQSGADCGWRASAGGAGPRRDPARDRDRRPLPVGDPRRPPRG